MRAIFQGPAGTLELHGQVFHPGDEIEASDDELASLAAHANQFVHLLDPADAQAPVVGGVVQHNNAESAPAATGAPAQAPVTAPPATTPTATPTPAPAASTAKAEPTPNP